VVEFVLLAGCLAIIALRATCSESLHSRTTAGVVDLSTTIFTLSVSGLLITAFLIWFVASVFTGKISYRRTSLEFALAFFIIAAAIAAYFAPDKRAAITYSSALIAPVLMAVLLVQLLDCDSKRKLLLIVIAALGVVLTYSCAEQFFLSNQLTIEQYENAPEAILASLGVRPGSFANMLLEHRIYSKDVRGFFSTGNSAGSFALLALVAGLAILAEKFKARLRVPFAPAITVAAILFGLLLTHSKGAIAAASLAVLMLVIYAFFRNFLSLHKKSILILLLLLTVVGGGLVVGYGLKHNRLPGGNSMLVRWQYFSAAAKMVADHPFTGVGPGNFANLYTHYKPPEALEAVTDPHNFPLSILTQFGLLGLVAFLALILVPLLKVVFLVPEILSVPLAPNRKPFSIFAFTILLAFLAFWPMIIKTPSAVDTPVLIYAIITLYIIPVIIFALAFWLLSTKQSRPISDDSRIIAIILCGIVAFLVHNLIDFAIFEPGIYTAFWAMMACLIALGNTPSRSVTVAKPAKVLIPALTVAVFWAWLAFCFIPPVAATANIRHARAAASMGDFDKVHKLFNAAAKADPLSPDALSLDGRAYLQQFGRAGGSSNQHLLSYAEDRFTRAIERNRADFKNYRRLADLYLLRAQISTADKKNHYLTSALNAAEQAVVCYPASAQLRIKLAEIAELLDKNDIALENYRRAIAIEDDYRDMFKIMYPDREVFPRLSGKKYTFAMQKIAELATPKK